MICLLTGLRADSAGALRPHNVKFVDGHLVVDVLRCKTADEPRTKTVPAPSREHHSRHRAFEVIRRGSRLFNAHMFGKHASTAITEAMQTYLRPGEVAPNTYVSSHSWRKAGASVLWVKRAGQLMLIAYGGWATGDRSLRTIARYVDTQYVPTTATAQLMDAYN